MTLRHSCISSKDKLKLLESLLFEGEPDQAILFPFGHDHHSNMPPPTDPKARKDIRQFIGEINQEVSCIAEQLGAVRTIEKLLKQRQCAFVRSAKYLRFQLAPIRLLPDEILLYIFQETGASEAYEHKETGHCTTFDVKKSPWVLTHVCRRWRCIVVSAPSMWTNINIMMSRPDFSFPPYGAPELLRLHLERSQSSPLDVEFHYRVTRPNEKQPWKPLTLFQALLDHGDHIRFFDVDYYDAEAESYAVRAVQFPQLHTLRFYDSRSPTWLNEALMTASKLYKLDIPPHQFRRMLALPQIVTLFSHITILILGSKLCDAHPKLALRALVGMPNLEQCALYLRSDLEIYAPITPLPQSVVMKALSALKIHSYFGIDTGGLFSRLTLPSLKILDLSTPSDLHPISQLIERSKCCISNLKIEVTKQNVGELTSMLEHMPILNCLTICLDALSSDMNMAPVFQALVAEKGSTVLCPNLERLTFDVEDVTKLQVQILIRLKRSRSVSAINGVAFLRFLSIPVYFDEGPRLRAAAVDALHEMIQTKGLDELWNVCEADPRTDLELHVQCRDFTYCVDSETGWTEVENSLMRYDI